MQEYKPFKEGKVRQVFDIGENLVIYATDRISAFDYILKNTITNKGVVLTKMSKFWFDFTKDIVPNHMISTDVKDMPEFFQKPEFEGHVMMCKKLEMLPIECIVRGYITGSGWASYQKDGTVCGIKLPEGLTNSLSLSTHQVQRLSWETMMRMFPLRLQWTSWRNLIRAKEESMQRRSAIILLHYIKNVQNTLLQRTLSLRILNLSLV